MDERNFIFCIDAIKNIKLTYGVEDIKEISKNIKNESTDIMIQKGEFNEI